ncbi:hypothetical protein TB2_046638 [Malus domestica]
MQNKVITKKSFHACSVTCSALPPILKEFMLSFASALNLFSYASTILPRSSLSFSLISLHSNVSCANFKASSTSQSGTSGSSISRKAGATLSDACGPSIAALLFAFSFCASANAVSSASCASSNLCSPVNFLW